MSYTSPPYIAKHKDSTQTTLSRPIINSDQTAFVPVSGSSSTFAVLCKAPYCIHAGHERIVLAKFSSSGKINCPLRPVRTCFTILLVTWSISRTGSLKSADAKSGSRSGVRIHPGLTTLQVSVSKCFRASIHVMHLRSLHIWRLVSCSQLDSKTFVEGLCTCFGARVIDISTVYNVCGHTGNGDNMAVVVLDHSW